MTGWAFFGGFVFAYVLIGVAMWVLYRSTDDLPEECDCCTRALALEKAFKGSIDNAEMLANALRRIKTSLAQFDSPTYESAAAYGGQILLMRQTVEAALNPSQVAASKASLPEGQPQKPQEPEQP